MRYLFFDIECIAGKHICSFGYTITDEQFNVVKKEDIVINPECEIKLIPNAQKKIELAYSEEYFLSQPNFIQTYDKISEILNHPDQIIFGHSITSDFYFLKHACQRYEKAQFNLIGYDIQKLYQILTKFQHVQSLESILKELNISSDEITLHKSCDDAYATMLVAKRISEKTGLDMQTLINKYNIKVNIAALVPSAKKDFARQMKDLREKYPLAEDAPKVTFSEQFDQLPRHEKMEMFKIMFNSGFDWTPKLPECDIFVTQKKKSKKEEACDRFIASGKNIKKVSHKEFLKLIEKNAPEENIIKE